MLAMQFPKNNPLMNRRIFALFFFICWALCAGSSLQAQVNMVEFGKNRVQFQKFKWSYYQTDNFNVYYNQHGEGLAKFVAQIAEAELPQLEKFTEYAIQRRVNIILYNSPEELKQTNIGLEYDWESTGGNTKLVNNKMVVAYNANHYLLKKQVRQGIARVLLDNVLFGDDLGEFAANQALLDLPKWLTDGYVSYAAENWSTELDDQLKSVLLSGNYRNFYQFAFDYPRLAGHAFWHFIAENYKKENVTYFIYLSRVYRNTNTASLRITKMKFKELLSSFMEQEEEKYYTDIRSRRNSPKGTLSVVEETTRFKDFFRFTPNPAPRSQTYAVVEYKHGIERVVLYEDYVNRKVLLKSGQRNLENIPNPNYPMMTWDGKGNRLAVVYYDKGKLRMFVYDMLTGMKKNKQAIEGFDLIQDIKFAVDGQTLLMSAVKKGQSDIFTYHIEKEKVEQVTNDIYDDLDPSFVAFPNKTGIIFSSNRPNAQAKGGDTALPSNHLFNIFLVDNWNKSEFKQISQLSRMRYGNARFPAQYNMSHFTFASDENGIMNRFAGFFTTEKAGIDTVYRIGDDILRNPEYKEIDSLLRAYDKTEPDSIFTFAITNDSSYVFPMTNYQSSLTETRAAGDNGQVSEMRREGDLKFLYKLKVDESVLKKRNINPRPTLYRQKLVNESKIAAGEASIFQQRMAADTVKKADVFESGFESDTARAITRVQGDNSKSAAPTVLSKAKRFDYKLKFSVDQVTGALFSNDVLVTRYEPYTGSLPVILNSNVGFNGMLKVTVYDLFEDLRFTGMIRIPLINTAGSVSISDPNVGIGFLPGTQSLFNSGSESLARFDYLKKRVDFNAMHYRRTDVGTDFTQTYPIKLFTNLYQAGIRYPFDRLRSFRMNAGYRTDRYVIKAIDNASLRARDSVQKFILSRMEYVYDNTVEKTTNIRNGLRYKAYVDINQQLAKLEDVSKTVFNVGFDARYYYPILRNFIWAGRAAADFSIGDQRILYYLGGTDGWLFPSANTANPPPSDRRYVFQSLALNMRGFKQNVANGNNAVTLNSEFRFPVFSTLFKRPINNAFLRNFQLVQFVDLGSAWHGSISNISRPTTVYVDAFGNPNISLKQKAGGVGPFVGGYGFGARSTLLGYFLRFDCAWPMDVFFKGKPIGYLSMGIDF
jgi:Tol biopolymer transport system component